jgi:hypothetical protein
MKKLLSITAFIILSIAALNLTAKTKETENPLSGEIEYPSKGLINFKEGTFEVWMSLMYKPGTDLNLYTDAGTGVTAFLRTIDIKNPLGNKNKDIENPYIFFGSNQVHAGEVETLFVHFSFLERKNRINGQLVDDLHVRIMKQLKWKKKNEWHHLAITWKDTGSGNYDCALFADGKEVAKEKFTLKEGILENDKTNTLLFGSLVRCYAAINELRLSNTALSSKEIKANARHSMKKDKTTTFLLNSSSWNKLKKAKTPLTRSNSYNLYKRPSSVYKNGQIAGAYSFIKGKYGKAVQLVEGLDK